MPRNVRVQYPGVLYRVVSCGDRCEVIFNENRDRERFLL
jgi:hypothetical protein